MRTTQSKPNSLIPVAILALLSTLNFQPSNLIAQGTAFTYQGLLEVSGSPTTGVYDFSFNLFNVSSGGTPVVTGVTNATVGVTNGLFSTTIDFGPVFTGGRYWLEIGSRLSGSTAVFQIMAPRTEMTPVPYAIFAENIAANTIGTANIQDSSVTYSKIAVPLELDASNPNGSVIFGKNLVGSGSGGSGVAGQGDIGVNGAGVSYGLYGHSTSASGEGVYGSGKNGVHGASSSASDSGVWGENTGSGVGVSGSSPGGKGVYGLSLSAAATSAGVWGENPIPGGTGVVGKSLNTLTGTGVYGESDALGGTGVYGANTGGGEAGHFQGTVTVNGTLTASALITSGDCTVAGHSTACVLTITGGCDLAEPFALSSQDMPKGAVVVIDDENPGRLKLSDRAYDTRVAGILSGANGVRAGICLSQQGFNDGGQNVALSGRVYALADASSSPIKPGDLLTTSNIPGHAMKVNDHSKGQGAIIGKAMGSLNAGKGMVLVLVTLQ